METFLGWDENCVFLKYTLVCCVPTLAVLGNTTHYICLDVWLVDSGKIAIQHSHVLYNFTDLHAVLPHSVMHYVFILIFRVCRTEESVMVTYVVADVESYRHRYSRGCGWNNWGRCRAYRLAHSLYEHGKLYIKYVLCTLIRHCDW